jgi:hypothetical protein
MSDVPFHRTPMGRRFFEHTAPELVRQLTRLSDLLDRALADRVATPPAPRAVDSIGEDHGQAHR